MTVSFDEAVQRIAAALSFPDLIAALGGAPGDPDLAYKMLVKIVHPDAPDPDLRICTSYDLDGVRWDRIVPGPFRDLAYQAGLTSLLSRARPGELYRPADWAAAIGDELGAPIMIESSGPRTSDKRIRALSAAF